MKSTNTIPITINQVVYQCSAPRIERLYDNEYFVFGSNLSGIHGAGAAKTANLLFGAEWGVGVGLTGRSYAFPTVSHNIGYTLSVPQIEKYAKVFISDVKNNPDKIFLVTEVGCGLAGRTVQEIAPLFRECLGLENVCLPLEFVKCLITK